MASLLDMRYKNKNKFKSSCKTAYLVAAATFSAKTAKEHILSLGKYDLYVLTSLIKQNWRQESIEVHEQKNQNFLIADRETI